MNAVARRWLGWLAVLAILLVAPASSADDEVPSSVHVARYEIDVTPHDDTASFRVLIEYGDAQSKTDGFKFFGTSPVAHLKVTDERRRALHYSTITQDRETKVTFDLAPGAAPHKTAILSFDQDLDVSSDWFERSASVTWASKFRIPIRSMTVRLHGVDAEAPFRCSGSGAARLCTRSSDGPFFVRFPMGRAPIWIFAGLLAMLGVAVVFVISIAARKRDDLIAARGVVPPVAEAAYVSPGDYRAAPVMPKGGAAEPKLSPDDQRALRLRLVGAAFAAGIPTLVMFAASGVASSPHFVSALALVIGATIFGYLVLRDKPSPSTFALPIGVAVIGGIGALIGGGAGGAIVGAIIGVFIFGFIHILVLSIAALSKVSWAKGGGSYSSGSSSCGGGGGSSCGGGGGSSCGGGGGSSCGGGGGGGGGCGG